MKGWNIDGQLRAFLDEPEPLFVPNLDGLDGHIQAADLSRKAGVGQGLKMPQGTRFGPFQEVVPITILASDYSVSALDLLARLPELFKGSRSVKVGTGISTRNTMIRPLFPKGLDNAWRVLALHFNHQEIVLSATVLNTANLVTA